jgi:hypothetical protein
MYRQQLAAVMFMGAWRHPELCSAACTALLESQVIKNGQMLGVWERRNRNTISMGSMAAATAKAEAAAAAEATAAAAAAAAPAAPASGRRARRTRMASKQEGEDTVAVQQHVEQVQQTDEQAVEQQADGVQEDDYGNGMAVIGEVELLRLFNDGGK